MDIEDDTHIIIGDEVTSEIKELDKMVQSESGINVFFTQKL